MNLMQSIKHWLKLARQQDRMAVWDFDIGISDGAVNKRKAALYRDVAKSLVMESKTGQPHCSTHFKPLNSQMICDECLLKAKTRW